MRVIFALLTLTAVAAIAAPLERHVLHEKRSLLPAGWHRARRLASNEILPVHIALAQSNINSLEQYLHEVSDPQSSAFGQHWTPQAIANAFRPSKETVRLVKEWVISGGIPSNRILLASSHGWFHFNATVQQAEALLKAEYHEYRHASGTPRIGCGGYHIPISLADHIDFVLPTVHFDSQVPRSDGLTLPTTRDVPGTGGGIGLPGGSVAEPKKGLDLPITTTLTELEQCDEYIVPDCLRVLYNIPPVLTNIQDNAYGIVEYSPQAYVQGDLDIFFANYSVLQQQTEPTLVAIDGGVLQQNLTGFEYNGESNLDLQYAMTLVNPIDVTLYQVGDPYLSASFNNFLDALDGSYCDEDGGDDPVQDSEYPDMEYPDGYQGDTQCGGAPLPKVVSTSYGYNEADLSVHYVQRQCNEWGKLGLMGITALFSSGDYGVAGNSGQCLGSHNGSQFLNSSGSFNPAFPSTCPYVTSVGATQIKSGASVDDPEVACETVIQSGGGFSNVFSLPTYQQAAMDAYYARNNPPYGSNLYNNSRAVRGYPDVAANGANYAVTLNGNFTTAYGTSASSPTFGAIITIINQYRALLGSGSIGFLNPTLYANPELLNDITNGTNPGCGTAGFSAVEGWDPVTGLGTPNAAAMLAFFLLI